MSLLDTVKATIDRILPVRCGPYEFMLDPEQILEREGGIVAAIRLCTYDGKDIRDIKEQQVLLIEPESASAAPERVTAYLEGWAKVLCHLVKQAEAKEGDWVMPNDCICPPALRDPAAQTAEDFAALILLEDGPMARWREEIAEEDKGVHFDEAIYKNFLEREQPETEEITRLRRAKALEEALAAFPAVNAKVGEVYGFSLPRSVAVYWAFFTSLSPAEREAYDTGLELPRPAGVLEYFKEGGLSRKTRDGLDARLDWRYRCDPPELVTALLGGSDAEHYGFFHDNPEKLPAGVVINYARDSAETWWAGATLLDVLRQKLERIEQEYLNPDYYADVERAFCQVRLLHEALAAFEDAEQEALREDEPRQILPYRVRSRLPGIVSGVGVAIQGASKAPPYVAELVGEPSPFRDLPRTRGFIAKALAALDRGEPTYALALGRDLHWADMDELRAETLELLTRAYRMLGREALARIAEVHHANRDLPSVKVFADD